MASNNRCPSSCRALSAVLSTRCIHRDTTSKQRAWIVYLDPIFPEPCCCWQVGLDLEGVKLSATILQKAIKNV